VEQILGVDFSGARDAGQKIWLTVCIERDGALHVKSSVPAGTQFDGDSRTACLRGVRAAIQRADVVGLDVPFGLPAAVHDRDTWAGVASMIADRPDPKTLQSNCVERAEETTDGERRYLRRATDEARGTLSPYHWIHAAQTHYGISELLQPLVDEDAVRIEPLQDGPGTPICETHPTATLRDIGLPTRGYKDNTDRSRTRRRTIVEGLQMTPLALHGIENHLLEDVGGDAIDSLLAALAAWRASRNEFSPDGEFDPVEGYIYV
jgi:predicted nuclease with RNAse H fold